MLMLRHPDRTRATVFHDVNVIRSPPTTPAGSLQSGFSSGRIRLWICACHRRSFPILDRIVTRTTSCNGLSPNCPAATEKGPLDFLTEPFSIKALSIPMNFHFTANPRNINSIHPQQQNHHTATTAKSHVLNHPKPTRPKSDQHAFPHAPRRCLGSSSHLRRPGRRTPSS